MAGLMAVWAWACVWGVALEGSARFGAPWVSKRIGFSKFKEEDCPYQISETLVAPIKSILISLLAYDCGASSLLDDLTLCKDPWVERRLPLVVSTFVGFEVADLMFMFCHGIATYDGVFHHVLHGFMGGFSLVRPNALSRATRLLLMQESSGVLLNLYLLLRHRSYSRRLVTGLFIGFFLLFLRFRIWGGAQALWWTAACAGVQPQALPASLALGLCATGYSLQIWWLALIVRKLLRGARRD